jgi:hypothetical protein
MPQKGDETGAAIFHLLSFDFISIRLPGIAVKW